MLNGIKIDTASGSDDIPGFFVCTSHAIALTATQVHVADTVHYIQLRIERRRAVKCLTMCSQCLWCIHDCPFLLWFLH